MSTFQKSIYITILHVQVTKNAHQKCNCNLPRYLCRVTFKSSGPYLHTICRQNSNVITVHLVLPPTHHNHLILMQRSNGIDTFTLMVFGGVFVVISNPPRGGIYANDMDIGEYIAPELVPNNIDHQHIVLVYISKYLILQITQSAISHQKQSKQYTSEMSFGMQYLSYINPTVLEVVDIYLFL